jgi:tRNA(Ile)-lysidine synthase
MALATLYSKAVQANESLPKYHAIIIDHKVRPESTDEAHWVAEQLRLRCELEKSRSICNH